MARAAGRSLEGRAGLRPTLIYPIAIAGDDDRPRATNEGLALLEANPENATAAARTAAAAARGEWEQAADQVRVRLVQSLGFDDKADLAAWETQITAQFPFP